MPVWARERELILLKPVSVSWMTSRAQPLMVRELMVRVSAVEVGVEDEVAVAGDLGEGGGVGEFDGDAGGEREGGTGGECAREGEGAGGNSKRGVAGAGDGEACR